MLDVLLSPCLPLDWFSLTFVFVCVRVCARLCVRVRVWQMFGATLCRRREPAHVASVKQLLREMLQRHRAASGDLWRYLAAHCPLPARSHADKPVHEQAIPVKQVRSCRVGSPMAPVTCVSVAACAGVPLQVFAFVRSVMLRVVPSALWGTPASQRVLFSKMYAFVKQGRGDTIRIEHVSSACCLAAVSA